MEQALALAEQRKATLLAEEAAAALAAQKKLVAEVETPFNLTRINLNNLGGEGRG